MGILEHKFSYNVRSRDCDCDIKSIINSIYNNYKNSFSELIVSENGIVFVNGFIVTLLSNWHRFGEISIGEIKFEERTNQILIRSKISIARYVLFYTSLIISIVAFMVTSVNDDLLFILVGGSVLIAFIVISSQLSAFRFKNMVKKSISNCGLLIK